MEKVFDIACTLIDVMSCGLIETRSLDYLNELVTLITLRGGKSRFLPLLMARIEDSLPAVIVFLPSNVIG